MDDVELNDFNFLLYDQLMEFKKDVSKVYQSTKIIKNIVEQIKDGSLEELQFSRRTWMMKKLNRSIEDLETSIVLMKRLKKLNIIKLNQLVLTKKSVLLKNLGNKHFKEVENLLKELDLDFEMNIKLTKMGIFHSIS